MKEKNGLSSTRSTTGSEFWPLTKTDIHALIRATEAYQWSLVVASNGGIDNQEEQNHVHRAQRILRQVAAMRATQ